MELPLNNAIAWTESSICCCCFKDAGFKDISSEYYYSGEKEVYGNMLKDTFDIQISQHNTLINIPHICDSCIMKLRDATAFKQMVLENVMNYTQYLDCLQHEKVTHVTADEVKEEEIKFESQAMDQRSDDVTYNYEDNEILANLKSELSLKTAILDSTVERHHKRVRKLKLKKCKIKPNATGIQKQKDWSKIVERRGSGPVLRENSLKLLANSTICAFQWNRSRYRCFCCKEPFSDVNELRQHTQNAHNLKNIEQQIIAQQNRLVKVEISKLNCTICNSKMDSLTMLTEHLIDKHDFSFATKHHLLVPFKIESNLNCQICNEKFHVFRLLNIHMNRHYQNHVCHVCGAGFSNLVFLNLHKSRTHRPIKCKVCNDTFPNRVDKKHHEVAEHGVTHERKLRFPCSLCDQRFFQENYRVQHLVEKHGLKRPEFKCVACSKVFITRSLCNNHAKNVHMKEKIHECDVCHRYFYTKSDVNRHKVTHTGEKNFSCGVCNNLFASKDSLRRHLKRTHGDH